MTAPRIDQPRIVKPQRAGPLRDPAPSKWGYRWQRWMLTPGVRTSIRIGTPLLVVGIIAGGWAAQQENRALVIAKYEALKAEIQHRPQFMVTELAITGADEDLADRVTALVPVTFPVSSFDLDLNGMRAKVAALDEVRDVVVRVADGGALEIAITPRMPVALWRTPDGLKLIDADGTFAGAALQRADRLDLPLIAGDGAQDHIDEALALFRSASVVSSRVRGLVRIGERRWDMVLDRDQRIMLPEDQPVAALDRVIALEREQELLKRDVAVVDMRNPTRPTVRLKQDAVAATRNASETGATN